MFLKRQEIPQTGIPQTELETKLLEVCIHYLAVYNRTYEVLFPWSTVLSKSFGDFFALQILPPTSKSTDNVNTGPEICLKEHLETYYSGEVYYVKVITLVYRCRTKWVPAQESFTPYLISFSIGHSLYRS